MVAMSAGQESGNLQCKGLGEKEARFYAYDLGFNTSVLFLNNLSNKTIKDLWHFTMILFKLGSK